MIVGERTGYGGSDAGDEAQVVGVLRAYTTRHGPGPLVTEDAALTTAMTEPHNPLGVWQGPFRAGHFDAVAHRYAVEVAGGVDEVALTHMDRIGLDKPSVRFCVGYEAPDGRPIPLMVGERGDLAYQAWLTSEVMGALPVYDTNVRSHWGRSWVTAVEDVLEVPVTIESYGPTSDDKVHEALVKVP